MKAWKVIGSVVGWFFTCFFLLSGLLFFGDSAAAGLLFLGCALLSNPLFFKLLRKKKQKKLVFLVPVLFVTACVCVPTSGAGKENSVSKNLVQNTVSRTGQDAEDVNRSLDDLAADGGTEEADLRADAGTEESDLQADGETEEADLRADGGTEETSLQADAGTDEADLPDKIMPDEETSLADAFRDGERSLADGPAGEADNLALAAEGVEAAENAGQALKGEDGEAGQKQDVGIDKKAAGAQYEKLEVHFIDVGQGDCTLVVCGGEAMLIDAGDNNKGTTVQLYLKKQGVDKLKYVVGTHPDADHIGGLDVILYKFDCEAVILPDKSSDTATYRDVMDTLRVKNYKITYPGVGDTYMLGDAAFTVLGPGRDYADDNNCSVVLKLQHGTNSFLFTGDAMEEAEKNYTSSGCDLRADVLKVAHHGSRNSTCSEFLDKVSPKCAVISCGEDNQYGHPHAETMNKLRAGGCQVYRTDEQGSIIVTSDGKELVWNCSPSETWKSGEPKIAETENSQEKAVAKEAASGNTKETVASPAQDEGKQNEKEITAEQEKAAPSGTRYILNTNSKKFHYPTCASVKKMKDKNKRESSDSRDVIISQGYVPCKNCNP